MHLLTKPFNQPQFGAIRVNTDSFIKHFKVPEGQEPAQMAQGIRNAFSDMDIFLANDQSIQFLESHFNADIEISAQEEGIYRFQLVETLPQTGGTPLVNEKKIFLFRCAADRSSPKDMLAEAISIAHCYYGREMIAQRDALKRQLADIQQNLGKLGHQVLDLAGVKQED